MTKLMSRRTVLQGIGASVALPWLEAMGPFTAWASQATPAGNRVPTRMAFVYVPNGMHMADFTPPTVGKLDKLPDILAPLESVKEHINVMTGLKLDKANANGDGAGGIGDSFAGRCTVTTDGN